MNFHNNTEQPVQQVYAHLAFVDIDNFSLREPLAQARIITRFSNCLTKTLHETRQLAAGVFNIADEDFTARTVVLPRGDSALIGFLSEPLKTFHVSFSESFLRLLYSFNLSTPECEHFDKNGWCNCHDKFNVKIGISEGSIIVYSDVNSRANMAGGALNLAVAIAAEANRNQILVAEPAFRQLTEMPSDSYAENQFLKIESVELVENLPVNMYILKSEQVYINNHISERVLSRQKLKTLSQKLYDGQIISVSPAGKNDFPTYQVFEELLRAIGMFRPL